jgi:hypothetical protein
MYVNAKMILVESLLWIRGGGRGWTQMWYIWYIVRTVVNATMYPHAHNKEKNKITK